MDPATAGTVGFLIRLVFLVASALFALRAAGLEPETLAVGGAITAVVFGLAAQQTLGNLIAGMVLISARPFKVGDRVRLQAGGIAGQIEGVVASLGLLYTTFAQGQDSIMVPNNVVLTAAVVPLREPASVDLRARLRPDVKPSDLQALLEETVATPVRSEPHISLEEVDRDEVVVRIAATPVSEADGPKLADEVLAAIAVVTREGEDELDGRRAGQRRPRRRLAAPHPHHAGVRELEARLALVALAASISRGDLARAQPALHHRGQLRREARERGAEAQRERGDVDLRRSCSIARTTAAPTSSGVLVPDVGRQLRAGRRGTCPASRMKPGKTVETPTPRGRRSSRRPMREAAQAELRRRVDRRADGGGLAAQRGHEDDVAAAALDHAVGHQPRQDHRRAQVDVERPVDLLDRERLRAGRWPGSRRWRPARRPVRRPRPASPPPRGR